jgi:hypothetical protein
MAGNKANKIDFSWTWKENKKKLIELINRESWKLRNVGRSQSAIAEGMNMVNVVTALTMLE